jgi:uncharacterized protein (DUF952 family)
MAAARPSSPGHRETDPEWSPLRPETVYRILQLDEWQRFQADGKFEGSALDRADGFIHLSESAQVADTLRTHFRPDSAIRIAAIATGVVAGQLRWEISRGGEIFPHLYGPLPLRAVIGSASLIPNDLGSWISKS